MRRAAPGAHRALKHAWRRASIVHAAQGVCDAVLRADALEQRAHISAAAARALARAIVTRPELVLFDEPTAGLDPLRRNSVFEMVAKYQRQLSFTAVLVTHDVPEALAVSDRIALLDGGRMGFQGTPAEFAVSDDPAVRSFRDSATALHDTIAALRRGENIPSEDSP